MLTIEALGEALKKHIPDRHRNTIPANLKALEQGASLARKE